MKEPRPYRAFSRFLRDRFGGKVYRVTIDAGFTCPNVDGTVAVGGCVYCDNRSFSPNRRLPRQGVREQVSHGVEIMRRRYGASKFLAYFQAGTNTYAPVEKLQRLYDEALEHPEVVGLMIGTRPDCVPDPVLDLVQDRSLDWMNRGHHFDAFVDAMARCKGRGLHLCAHVILGLPGESADDMLATADACAAFDLDAIKIHNLHVVRDTPMEADYRAGRVRMLDRDEYVNLVCDFLERLPPRMVIQRLTGDAPPDYLVAPDWCLDKSGLLADFEREFARRGTRQGSKFAGGVQPSPARISLGTI